MVECRDLSRLSLDRPPGCEHGQDEQPAAHGNFIFAAGF
jgi:hypothetical protein